VIPEILRLDAYRLVSGVARFFQGAGFSRPEQAAGRDLQRDRPDRAVPAVPWLRRGLADEGQGRLNVAEIEQGGDPVAPYSLVVGREPAGLAAQDGCGAIAAQLS
jgi:hypothetical protein